MPRLQHEHEFFKEFGDGCDFAVGALNRDLVAPHMNPDWKRAVDEVQQFVALTEQIDHEVIARHEDGNSGRCSDWFKSQSVESLFHAARFARSQSDGTRSAYAC